MSKLFTRRQYRLPSGLVIDLPLGVSLHEFPPPRGTAQVTVNLRGVTKTFSSKSMTTNVKLISALKFIVEEIDSGKIPGTCVAEPDKGICTVYHRDHDSFAVSVLYPCVELGKSHRKEFYLGTTATKENKSAATYARAQSFRKEKLAAYAQAFKIKVLDTIKALET